MKGKTSRIPRPSGNSKKKQNQRIFTNEIEDFFQQRRDSIENAWVESKSRITKKVSEIDSALDSCMKQLFVEQENITIKLNEIMAENRELNQRAEQLRREKSRLIAGGEKVVIEKQAEIDLEIDLQKKSVDLHHRINEAERTALNVRESVLKYKKGYARVIEQFNQLKKLVDEEEMQRYVRKKKLYLQKKQQEINAKKDEEILKKKNPLSKYQNILAAAGQTYCDAKPVHSVVSDEAIDVDLNEDEQIVENFHDYDQEINIEQRIQLLLATGNYTEADPVIRSLRKELAIIKS